MKSLIETENSFLNTCLLAISADENLLAACIAEIDSLLIHRPPIVVFNKQCHQPRSVGFFSDTSEGYFYSRQMMNSQSLTPNMTRLLEITNELFDSDFNGILVNKYKGGEEYLSAHSDNERDLSPVGVVGISYGEERNFRIRNKKTKAIVLDLPTTENMYIHMGGDFQKEFTHEIPIQRKKKGTRYSFTFRKHDK
jgi:alkylated DNA repair dioxygenase AlkB